jgi:hypothetical protein
VITRSRNQKSALEGASGGIFLIGLGILFLSKVDFFPWILVVIGLASLPGSVAREGFWAGMQGFIWLVGLAILFATDTIWPGILILAGLSILAGSIVRPPAFEKSKRKRGLPPTDDDLYDE